MHAPCLLAADSVGESLRAAASSQTACCVPVHAVGCMQGCMQGACSTGRRVKIPTSDSRAQQQVEKTPRKNPWPYF
jgi:hypothetical protein